MIIRRNSLVSVPLVLVALALSSRPTPAPGCSFSEPTLFVTPYAPDTPPARYVAGELGVLQPTWIRAYLVVAYLDLAGIPLTAGERRAAVSYLEGPAPPGTAGLDAWTKARDAATGAPGPQIETERSVGYTTYVNCGDDAFRQAAETLASYEKTYGSGSAETRDWIDAQNAVFWSCGGAAPRDLPDLPEGAPAARRADRAYQIAASSFYAGRLEEARKAFEEIASDAGSRWRNLAPYLAARAVLRQATLAEEPVARRARFAEARTRFASLADRSPDPRVRQASSDLVRFVDLRLDPAARVPEAAALLVGPLPDEDFRAAFIHYRDLLFRVLGWGPEPGGYVPDPKDDLTSWVVAFQDPAPRGLERALAGFSRTPSLPWIAAVLSKIPASHPRAAEVVEAARRLPGGGAERLHVAYHLARLATEAGRTAEARALVDESLAAASAAGASARNLFLELKARNAATFEEFAAAAPHVVVWPDWLEAGDQRFDDYTRDVLNRRLPLDVLVRFAGSASLGTKAAASMRRVVLTRAILLGRADIARAFAPPGAKVNWEAADWRVDATLAILVEDSESRPYDDIEPSFQIAWWCALPGPAPWGRDPAFLSDAERRAAADEVARLAAEPPAATWFTREALAFARKNPKDPRAPEFLARAVRATREGCADAETRSLSKAAFGHLHARYPKSPWATGTKYWFEGRGWYPPAQPRKSPQS